MDSNRRNVFNANARTIAVNKHGISGGRLGNAFDNMRVDECVVVEPHTTKHVAIVSKSTKRGVTRQESESEATSLLVLGIFPEPSSFLSAEEEVME